MAEHRDCRIIGAGIAGLTSAIIAARAGWRTTVYERRSDVGSRFHGDFQGIENWTTENDALEEIASFGIEPSFYTKPVREQICFGPDGQEYVFKSPRPFYYLVRRGRGQDTLDQGLKMQALSAGVDIRFGVGVRDSHSAHVVGWGARRADALATGYLFDTNVEEGFYGALNDSIAPKGYSYLLVSDGAATLAVCIFDDFPNHQLYLQRTLEFFKRRVSLEMRNVRKFGGIGNVFLPPNEGVGRCLSVGEAAGLQDALWGFGIRYATLSGYLAARSLLAGTECNYRRLWKKRIGDPQRVSFVNRYFYERAGDRGYLRLLKRLQRAEEPGAVLRELYAPALWKRILFTMIHCNHRTRTLRESANFYGSTCLG